VDGVRDAHRKGAEQAKASFFDDTDTVAAARNAHDELDS
jgi:hypothetical protein